MPYDIDASRGTGGGASGTGTQQTGNTANRSRVNKFETPSSKYKEIEMPNPVTMQRAASPPKPTLPRRSEPRSWKATARERYPLTSSLTGPGRAGKQGELMATSGGKYEGEVLAGRPHGFGRYLVQKRPGEWAVQYEGDWIQGRREGRGTRFYANGEVYTGDFVANLRHGGGRYEYANGDIYAGQWSDDKRHGAGTLYFSSGDIFIGNFLADRREGMGTLYMMGRQKKYVAEYVKDSPKCGTVLEIEDSDLAPIRGHLAQLATLRKLDAAAAGEAVPRLPALQLQQPSKVLAGEVVAVRRDRAAGTRGLKEVQANSGTLTERDIEMLRHSYTLMAAGDTPGVGLLPHQLRELCVMAGLDPAASSTKSLVEELVRRKDASTGRINFDNFMKVVTHFQEEAIAARAAAAVEVVAAATMGHLPNAAELLSATYAAAEAEHDAPAGEASASGGSVRSSAGGAGVPSQPAGPASARSAVSATGSAAGGGGGGSVRGEASAAGVEGGGAEVVDEYAARVSEPHEYPTDAAEEEEWAGEAGEEGGEQAAEGDEGEQGPAGEGSGAVGS